MKPRPAPVPQLHRLRLADGFAVYAAVHPPCGLRRGWAAASAAHTTAADLGHPDALVEAYVPGDGPGVCACALTPA